MMLVYFDVAEMPVAGARVRAHVNRCTPQHPGCDRLQDMCSQRKHVCSWSTACTAVSCACAFQTNLDVYPYL